MADQLTQAELLEVVDRAVDEGYIAPLKDPGPGYELYQASAKVGERCSLAVKRFEDDVFILTSRGGVLATVPVTFYRTTAAAGAGTMLAGTIVRASVNGATFRTTSDATFGANALTATTTAEALGYGYEWNILGPFVDRDSVSWPGQLDTIDLPLQSPVFWDPTIQVRNDAPADGLGRPRTLDVLGGERNLPRHPNEGDVGYRIRIRTLPDTVSPAAIRRQLANYFRAIPGLFFRHVETWTHEYQECWDAPNVGPALGENFNTTLFVFDDPRPDSPLQNVYYGEADRLGAIVVEVGMPPVFSNTSMAYDDTADDLSEAESVIGSRALSAYDILPDLPDSLLSPAYDGTDPGLEGYLVGLFNLLEQIKGGGVNVVIVIQQP